MRKDVLRKVLVEAAEALNKVRRARSPGEVAFEIWEASGLLELEGTSVVVASQFREAWHYPVTMDREMAGEVARRLQLLKEVFK